MYKSFFGLRDHPFRNTPDEDFFFSGSQRGDIVDAIVFTIRRGDAIVAVIGEVGSGKTTLIRVVANKLKEEHYVVVYIPNPNFSSDDILSFIANELGLSFDKNDTKFKIYNKISKKLLDVFKNGKRVAIIIDEAHLIPLDTLEEIRLLSNLETGKEKLLSIILVGQPELKKKLSLKEARQLKSRITYEFELTPFSEQETFSYLNFRMKRAGYTEGDVFPSNVANIIHKQSNGYPRIINNIADQVLITLYAKGKKRASSGDLADIKFKGKKVGFSILFVFLLFFVFYFLYNGTNVLINKGVSLDLVSQNLAIRHVNQKVVTTKDPMINNFELKGKKVFYNSSNKEEFKKETISNTGFSIGVVTTPCNDVNTIKKVIHTLRNFNKNILLLKFQGKEVEWCKIYLTELNAYAEASNVIASLPSILLKNKPFIIENEKINELIKERNAHVEIKK